MYGGAFYTEGDITFLVNNSLLLDNYSEERGDVYLALTAEPPVIADTSIVRYTDGVTPATIYATGKASPLLLLISLQKQKP